MIYLISIAVLLILGLLVFAYVPRPAPAASGSSINVPSQWHAGRVKHVRVGTYNIHRGRGTDGRHDLRRTAAVIRGVEIAALQEVGMESWTTPQVQSLGTLLDMGWLYMPTRYRWFHNDRGNGLLSVFPVNHWHCERLPHNNRRTPRNLTSARVLLSGRELWVLVTHLTTRTERSEQLKIVLDRFRHYSPAILLGDLNTTRDDPLLAEYLEQEGVVDALAMTLAENDPRQRVDWILTRGLHIVAGGMNNDVASDHPYYWADLEFI